MNGALKLIAQGVMYGLFGWLVAYWSDSPAYHYLRPDQAELQLAFRHASQSKEPCVERSKEDMDKLAPNMRRAKVCPRERSPLRVLIEMDGKPIHQRIYHPTGVHKDLSVYVFEQLTIPGGMHEVVVRMNDSVRVEGYNYQHTEKLMIAPGRVLVMGLDEETKTFHFR